MTEEGVTMIEVETIATSQLGEEEEKVMQLCMVYRENGVVAAVPVVVVVTAVDDVGDRSLHLPLLVEGAVEATAHHILDQDHVLIALDPVPIRAEVVAAHQLTKDRAPAVEAVHIVTNRKYLKN